jgi:hypothetical protein
MRLALFYTILLFCNVCIYLLCTVGYTMNCLIYTYKSGTLITENYFFKTRFKPCSDGDQWDGEASSCTALEKGKNMLKSPKIMALTNDA